MATSKQTQRLESILTVVKRQHSAFTRTAQTYHQQRCSSISLISQRSLHTTRKHDDAAMALPPATATISTSVKPQRQVSVSDLADLPLSQILRTLLITGISSSPRLLASSSFLLRQTLESKSFIFSLERNPAMRALLWETFYKQFCAGEKDLEVGKMCQDLRHQGFAGVILEYALEVLKDAKGDEATDVETWRKGVLDTISISQPGDFVGLKWSGMGVAAFRRMEANDAPSERMEKAMREACDAAAERGVSLLPAAEETWTLEAFHRWCLDLQREYNVNGRAVVYTTYQCYLHQTASFISKHLEMAKQQNFTLGAKLVRGAYLASEKRDLIFPTIEATHAAYDAVAAALLTRRFNDTIVPAPQTIVTEQNWPDVNVMIASHNMNSVQTAMRLRRDQAFRGEKLTTTTFAQLQGMADEVSCSLIAAGKRSENLADGVKERVYKCATWGPMYECLNYLLRRASENKDAASRTRDTRVAMQGEIWRRIRATFGLA
ncbi:FAD-linked oxidoreductase [Polychaeton citri CBS 116435]|uniref:Proline dehydrogenase n=1 Tax=Polychaeton citri CBS 116435 TaxID=1314669 RepID=A0A9P4UL10_9PEZI|nr:FAD-linked oxidoreductase [Polychaeton citri CBS 116435]